MTVGPSSESSSNVASGTGSSTAAETASDTASGTAPETVLVRVPADPNYLGVVRAACAQLGAKLGWSLAEVSDLRLAVGEICGFVLRMATRVSGDLECRFSAAAAALRVAVRVAADGFVQPDPDDFGWAIVTALVDDVRWHVDGPMVGVEVRKHRSSGW